jgi:hypothetical protein
VHARRNHRLGATHVCRDTDETEWCHIYFHFFYGNKNKYKKAKNKNGRRYFLKQIQTGYGAERE